MTKQQIGEVWRMYRKPLVSSLTAPIPLYLRGKEREDAGLV